MWKIDAEQMRPTSESVTDWMQLDAKLGTMQREPWEERKSVETSQEIVFLSSTVQVRVLVYH